VVGPARIGELPEILRERRAGRRTVATGFPTERRYEFDLVARDGLHKGMVTVIEGCDKNCTFCIVPFTRGPERCRPLAEIVAEVRHLLAYGFVEIELLGQTVNHWREPAGGLDFADLLEAVAGLAGLRRLRFVTSYPRDFTPRMVEMVGRHRNICPYLHLPVQSGSNRILRRMGRGYTVEEYLELADSLRSARSDLALSTDLIIGFPGETEEDLTATLRLLEQARFASLFAFCYSPRPGTAALRLSETVPEEVAARRLQTVLDLQNCIQREENEKLVGRTFEVLVTGWGREPGKLTGRTPCHRIVHFSSFAETVRPGALVELEIEHALAHSLLGRQVVQSDSSRRATPA